MKNLVFVLCALVGVSALDIKVANTGGNATSGYQYGAMFEVSRSLLVILRRHVDANSQDINQSGDGGIYAELIRNRAFQGSTVHPSAISPWTAVGGAKLSLRNLTQPLSTALPTSLNVAASSGKVGISNPGYWGIEVKKQKYTGSFWVKGSFNGSFTASLFNYLSNKTLSSVKVPGNTSANEWREHVFTLTPEKSAKNVNNTFRITYDASVGLPR
jgi:alpha-N-arabinofuranosidase